MKTNKFNIFLIICLMYILTACAQRKKSINETTMNTNFKKIENLYREIQHYPKETIYYIEANQNACFYELYVNDILVFKHFEQTSLLGHTTSINDAILKSGMQEVTVKLYPLGQTKVKNFETFTKNAEIKIKISKWDNTLDNKADTKEYDEYDGHVATFNIPQIEDKNNLISIKGLPYYEHTFTFYADIPYNIKGWSESKDLTKVDKEKLEKEVVAFYKKHLSLIKSKDAKEIENQIYLREKILAQSNFYSKEKLKKISKELKSNYITPIDVSPLEENYKMVFYANGRIVKLESKEYEKINNNSALSVINELNYMGTPRKAKIFLSLALHKPKGSNKLEIIR